jgi:hypothetical protein
LQAFDFSSYPTYANDNTALWIFKWPSFEVTFDSMPHYSGAGDGLDLSNNPYTKLVSTAASSILSDYHWIPPMSGPEMGHPSFFNLFFQESNHRSRNRQTSDHPADPELLNLSDLNSARPLLSRHKPSS